MKRPNRAAQILREILHNRGWTQRQLASMLGIDDGRMSRILGETLLADRALAMVCSQKLGVEPSTWDLPPLDEPGTDTDSQVA